MSAVHNDISAIGPLTDALIETASGFSAGDLSQPSLCEGWSRGHVLAHVARNADAIGRLADWAATGQRQEMYAGGTEGRDAEIERGAGRPPEEQVADLRESAQALARLLSALEGDLRAERVEARGGLEVLAIDLPFMRVRELVLHHVDLVAGYSLPDVDAELLKRLLDDAVMRLRLSRRAPSMKVRTDEGDVWSIGDGTAYVTGSRAGVLRWLSRRIGDGVVADGGLPELPRGA
jgi:maleylpyruvate isomerase